MKATSHPTDADEVLRAPILVTMGEPAGIGPELALAAFHALGGKLDTHPLRLVGDPDVFRACGHVPEQSLIATRALATPPRAGNPDPANALAVTEAIELAAEHAMQGLAAAIVTAPIQKAAMIRGGFSFPGHTEFLERVTGAERAVMMLVGPDLRVVPLTIHIPIADVPKSISTRGILETGLIIAEALRRDFAIPSPRIAVAGLNPHAGENGEIGSEDNAVIAPAVAALNAAGVMTEGPLPADTLFHEEARARYDTALCMFHDQALIPIKTLSFWEGVNVTLGLPIVRTSPDHGTALSLAGKGKADARSMIAAIRLAAKMADERARSG